MILLTEGNLLEQPTLRDRKNEILKEFTVGFPSKFPKESNEKNCLREKAIQCTQARENPLEGRENHRRRAVVAIEE